MPFARVTAMPAKRHAFQFALTTHTVADAAGYAEVGLAAAVRSRVIAVDPVSGGAGVVPEWWDGGRVRRVRLQEPVRLRFRVLLPDRHPAAGKVTLHPHVYYLAHKSVTLTLDAKGWVETPPVVPGLYFAWIYGIDPRVTERTKHRIAARRLPLEELRTGGDVVLEAR